MIVEIVSLLLHWWLLIVEMIVEIVSIFLYRWWCLIQHFYVDSDDDVPASLCWWCRWWSSIIDDFVFSTNMLMRLLLMFQYLYTDVADDGSVFTYWCCRWCFSIYILILQMMFQYSHTDVAEDDPKDDSVFTYWGCRRWSSILMLRLMMKIYDGVPKLPMTYRDSPVICAVVVVVATLVEYLPS